MSSDPRVFFAAERTLLAWVRSGITIIALGFVVAKFGLFLTLLSNSSTTAHHLKLNNQLSNIFGILLVLIGVAIVLGAQYNHHCYIRTLPTKDIPKLTITWLASLLTFSISIVGIMLAIYLAFA